MSPEATVFSDTKLEWLIYLASQCLSFTGTLDKSLDNTSGKLFLCIDKADLTLQSLIPLTIDP